MGGGCCGGKGGKVKSGGGVGGRGVAVEVGEGVVLQRNREESAREMKIESVAHRRLQRYSGALTTLTKRHVVCLSGLETLFLIKQKTLFG